MVQRFRKILLVHFDPKIRKDGARRLNAEVGKLNLSWI